MSKPQNLERLIARSQPQHQRSEDRFRFNVSIRKPEVKVERINKKFLDFSGVQEFFLIDISPNGACIAKNKKGKCPFSINEEVKMLVVGDLKLRGEVKWIVHDFELAETKEKILAIGIHLITSISKSQILDI